MDSNQKSIVIEVKPPRNIKKVLVEGANPMLDGFAEQLINVAPVVLQKMLSDSLNLQDIFSLQAGISFESEILSDNISLFDLVLFGLVLTSGYGSGGYGEITWGVPTGDLGLLLLDTDQNWDDSGILPSNNYLIKVSETMSPEGGVNIHIQ